MKSRLIASLILLSLGNPAFAHRLDEYLQATMISLEKDRVAAQIRLTPGVAVFPIVIATIDTDHDGVISKAEQRAYAERVLADLSLSIDGDRLRLQLISAVFPKVEEMREGLGDIQRNHRPFTFVQSSLLEFGATAEYDPLRPSRGRAHIEAHGGGAHLRAVGDAS